MAFWFDKTYATYWQTLRETDNYTDVTVSTSESKKTDDGKKEYTNSNWVIRLVGHAHNKFKAQKLNQRDKITLVKGKITNEPYKDKDTGEKKSALRVIVFDYEMADNRNDEQPPAPAKKPAAKKKAAPVEETEEELPF